MFPDYYLTELIITERQMQMSAEADRLRRIDVLKSKKSDDKKRRMGSITRHIRALGTSLFQKQKRLICQC